MCHLPIQVQGFFYCRYRNSCLGDVSGLSRFHRVIGYLPQTHSPSSPRASCPIAINKRVPHLSYTCPNPWYSSRLSSNSFSPIKPSLLQLSFTLPPLLTLTALIICISGTQPFWHWGQVSWRIIFFNRLGVGNSFRMIQAHHTYCALYFYYYYISSTSDHQALDPRGWAPPDYVTPIIFTVTPTVPLTICCKWIMTFTLTWLTWSLSFCFIPQGPTT